MKIFRADQNAALFFNAPLTVHVQPVQLSCLESLVPSEPLTDRRRRGGEREDDLLKNKLINFA